MENAKDQVAERLRQAANILVTVRNDPSVDLLCACLGLALTLDKLDKHAAAVFSGEIPAAIHFLKPEETIEPTPNSLRDFIIALDKSKADKLRYKVEDKVVRIFITPYKTSLSEADLEFSQGDFNIDVVIALGAHQQQELDQAITTHGRILHDATVVSINNTADGNLGTISWEDTTASSVSEMVARLADSLGSNVLDDQIATALLTGIVAETDRFSNEKTTPQTMTMAGELMAAGANQQLVANELQNAGLKLSEPGSGTSAEAVPEHADDKENDTVEIAHQPALDAQTSEPEKPEEGGKQEPKPRDTKRELLPTPEPAKHETGSNTPIDQSLFTQAYLDEEDMPHTERSFLVDQPVLSPKTDTPEQKAEPAEAPKPTPTDAPVPADEVKPVTATPPIAPPKETPDEAKPEIKAQTLEELERAVKGISQPQPQPENGGKKLDDARSQVLEALSAGPQPIIPRDDLNALPIAANLHASDAAANPNPPAIEVDAEGHIKMANEPKPEPAQDTTQATVTAAAGEPQDMPLPPVMEVAHTDDQGVHKDDDQPPVAPPPGPPPMLPPFPMNPAH